jgi:hypothetical protein
MTLHGEHWDIKHLREHLQFAAYLEAWTIPYYLSAMFSIKSRSHLAYQLIQSVVHQEMLHLQLVANIANAYGHSPTLHVEKFKYDPAEKIPHVKFELDHPNPEDKYKPHSAAIGRLDKTRINTMRLIEYPSWSPGAEKPVLRQTVHEYGSIGEFYNALNHGASQLAADIHTPWPRGGVRQVDMFSAFYRRMPRVQVESSGPEGLAQVQLLIDLIRDQGEAAKADDAIHPPHRNTADDPQPTGSHSQKFTWISDHLPVTYQPKEDADYTDDDRERQQILVKNFKNFIRALNALLAGENPDNFVPLMVTLGGNILTCWKNGVTPKFYEPPKST